MKELNDLMSPYVARLRKIGVTGDIMILTTCNDSVDKNEKRDPRESFARWTVWVNGKLVVCKYTWDDVEAGVREVLSGERRSAIERKRDG